MFDVSAFLFLCWLCFWYVFLLFLFSFLLLLVLLSDYEKHGFPATLVFSGHVGYKVVNFFSFMFWFLFVSFQRIDLYHIVSVLSGFSFLKQD